MISFACKDIDIKDLIKCSFDLNKTDYTLFIFLMQNEKQYSIEELSNKLKLERSSVQKAIKNLVFRKLVERKQINLDKGGYQFYYNINKKEEIKTRIEEIIDGWHRKVKEEISKWS
ncbi:helix-turn-helix domain-containing protein [Bacteroidota bacterium]